MSVKLVGNASMRDPVEDKQSDELYKPRQIIQLERVPVLHLSIYFSAGIISLRIHLRYMSLLHHEQSETVNRRVLLEFISSFGFADD
jgi:hypothetical protein